MPKKVLSPTDVRKIKTTDLQFDPENPRFYRLNGTGQDVTSVIEDMLDKEGALDLMNSIAQKGYFGGEPLLVVSADGKSPFTVVEGNRRLAAVKLLNGQILPPSKRKISVANVVAEALETPPVELPCLVYETRRDVLRYLGYRHITGIQEWDALSKAKYLKELRDEFYAQEAIDQQFRSLAKDIGSKPDYVAKLLTALELYERARTENNFFGLPLKADDIEFSYLTTALGYKSIPDWLGLKGPKDVDMPNLDSGNLRNLFVWCFSKDQDGRTILGESRNLSELSSIVTEPKAIQALVETKDINIAFLYTDGPSEALVNAMGAVQAKMNVVWRLVPETHAISSQHNELANEIFEFAKTIRNSIRDKLEDQ